MYRNELKAFVYAADCGSFNKAAEKLFISTTAVMKQMNQLEQHLGLKLLERTNHGIHLTECGKSLYKDAKFMISYSEKSLEKARKIAAKKVEMIRVGTSMLNPCKVFMELWYQLSDRFPQYKIQIVPFEDDHNGILSVIDKIGERFDFIVGVCDSAEWLSRSSFYKLGNYKKCIAVPLNHPLARKQCLDITDLYGETMLMVRRGDSAANDHLRDDLEKNHPAIHIEGTSNFYDINVFNYCEQTGKLLLNVECWKDIHPALVTLPVHWNYTIPYGLLYAKEPGSNATKFVETLKSQLHDKKMLCHYGD